MARVVKSNREVLDVNEEISKLTTKKEKKTEVLNKDDKKKKSSKTKTNKKKGKIRTFFSEIKKEMSKVKWPTKKELLKYSVASLIFIIFFALFFYVIELLMAFLEALV